jgi:hypothetical protein
MASCFDMQYFHDSERNISLRAMIART